MDSLSKYIKEFSNLRIDRSKGIPAPHKPILLLSVIQGIEQNEITENKIYITPELVACFKDNWHTLVHSEHFSANFALPFYHLKKLNGFWFLKTWLGREILLTTSNSIKSFSNLKYAVEYAFFSDDLYELLINELSRDILKRTLMNVYFSKQNSNVLIQRKGLINQVEDQILHEAPEEYKATAAKFDDEEVFIRSGVFKKVIPKIYNYTCCITGMRIIANDEIQMIDACHIIPFSESHDDTITNGISLCPNFHRAFDRGLVAVNENYEVVISKSFSENDSNYSIKLYSNRKILLPTYQQYHPLKQNLNWHYHNIFKRDHFE